MKKEIYLFIFLLTAIQFAKGQELPIPNSYSILDSISGDLDKDSKRELVVAYNTGSENKNESVPRELIIYKLENDRWVTWKKSAQALLGSRDGGMMGDPFEEIEIKNGILLISESGGSSWKWGFTDKYRFQNEEFYLIGHSSLNGKPCEYWQQVDFNISTGKMIVKKEFENCETEDQEIYKKENETLFEKGLKITLQERSETEIKITTPKYGHEIYL